MAANKTTARIKAQKAKKRKKKHGGLDKTDIFLSFETEQLLELKRVLFRFGLTAHQFFGFLIEKMSVGDVRLEEMLMEATAYKRQRVIEGKENKLDAETLYRMIEEQNQNKQHTQQ